MLSGCEGISTSARTSPAGFAELRWWTRGQGNQRSACAQTGHHRAATAAAYGGILEPFFNGSLVRAWLQLSVPNAKVLCSHVGDALAPGAHLHRPNTR